MNWLKCSLGWLMNWLKRFWDRLINWLKRFFGAFDPTQGWSKNHKVLTYFVIIVLIVLLILFWNVFGPSGRVVERIIEKPAVTLTATATSPPTTVTTSLPPTTVVALTTVPMTVIIPAPTTITVLATVTATTTPPPPAPIIWPKAARSISSDEARSLLIQTFPNKRVTGAHFGNAGAALYTLEQFKEIRSKMAPITTNNLPWPSLIDKVIGMFQEPGIEDLPVGWAYPTNPDPSLMYLITILYDGGKAKIFGFDPLDKAKIWEVTTDPRVECAFVR